ncbi:hypothetical protein GVAMD_0663 [Gardnerella vaginalis AMD]|nr:hypothetical protein GVAMD_0663 [Gardnerella vaginalis AMD]
MEVRKKILIASVTEIPKLPNKSSALCFTLGSIRMLMFAVLDILLLPTTYNVLQMLNKCFVVAYI